MGTFDKSKLSEGERDVLLRVVGDTALPALPLRDSLHQQVGVIAPQIVKHHGDAGVFFFSFFFFWGGGGLTVA